ncbi:hypothetical protein PFISCL1PPCAC_28595 [Pristionchus fissidentatus]|uniref:Uncharacterized protein n=1 Tax=Pristionchus fissidentatus TaxID=1538716 RepID=A0AAV5W166_9BILA|nr:hypothetical protein PFISCL1PPCAC_16862 [Pristionchus fissidentatus]GMT37298.1 hypothetical protein PFISCL1PPCAC_28595 [Pristionchus fissidentatus]
MPLTVCFGANFERSMRYDVNLEHAEDTIRALLAQKGFCRISRVTTLIGDTEVPIEGHAQDMDYRAYVEPSTTSPTSTTSSASVPLPLNHDTNQNLPSHESRSPTPQLNDSDEEDNDVDVEGDSSIDSSREVKPFRLKTELNSLISDNNEDDMDESAVHEVHGICVFDREKVSGSIIEFDLVGNMRYAKNGKKILSFIKKGGNVNRHKLWRPRLIRYFERQIMKRSKKYLYPCKDERLCFIAKLQSTGIQLRADILDKCLERRCINKRISLKNAGSITTNTEQ